MLAQRARPERSRRVGAGTRTIQNTSTGGAADMPALLLPSMASTKSLAHDAAAPRPTPPRSKKTIPSHSTPRTIKTCAPANTASFRASVLCWSFFACSPRPSALRAAPSPPARSPTPTNNRQPVAIISRSIPAVLPCSLARLLPPAFRQTLCSQFSPHSSPVCSPPILILTCSPQS